MNHARPPRTRRRAAGERNTDRQDTDEVKELKRRLAELEKLVSRLVPDKS